MTFEEKGHWVFLFTCIASYIAYAVITLGQATTMPLVDVNYVPTMIGAILTAIILTIVSMIGIAIAKPSEADKKDVRDKEIDRFGEYVGGIVVSTLMIIPFVFAVLNFDQFWIANAMYAVFVVSGIVGAIVKIVRYRRG